jgi:hypothetical protein
MVVLCSVDRADGPWPGWLIDCRGHGLPRLEDRSISRTNIRARERSRPQNTEMRGYLKTGARANLPTLPSVRRENPAEDRGFMKVISVFLLLGSRLFGLMAISEFSRDQGLVADGNPFAGHISHSYVYCAGIAMTTLLCGIGFLIAPRRLRP